MRGTTNKLQQVYRVCQVTEQMRNALSSYTRGFNPKQKMTLMAILAKYGKVISESVIPIGFLFGFRSNHP